MAINYQIAPTSVKTGYEDATLELHILASDEACVAVLEIYGADGVEEFRGWAKKHPKDSPNVVVGTSVALQRVFAEAAEYFERVSNDLVEINTQVIRHRILPFRDGHSNMDLYAFRDRLS